MIRPLILPKENFIPSNQDVVMRLLNFAEGNLASTAKIKLFQGSFKKTKSKYFKGVLKKLKGN
ncbi:MAG: hypothetical protein ACO26G_01300 [Rickettsiales bacterium]